MYFPVSTYRPSQGGLPYTPPLDAQNAAAAYSIRKLRTDYTGNCIRIANASGTTNLDIGFDSNGYLDVSAIESAGTGSETFFISTWYDQTGNGLDLSNGNLNNRPKISTSGTVELVNGLAAMLFDGSNDVLSITSSTGSFNFLHNGTKCQIVCVNQWGITANPNALLVFLANRAGNTETGVYFGLRDVSGVNNAYQSEIARSASPTAATLVTADNTMTPNTQLLTWHEFDADNATAADRLTVTINGGSVLSGNTNTAAPSAGNATRNLQIGSNVLGAFYFTGYSQELIIYDTDQSSNKSTLQSNINSYFSIY